MADPIPGPLLWIIPVFFVLFVVLWVGIIRLLAVVSGWSRLAVRFAGTARDSRDAIGWSSARLGLVSYRNMLTVQVGEEGLGLVPQSLFKMGHPPLLLPWRALVRCVPGKTLFVEHIELEIEGDRSRLILYGHAAKIVRHAWELRHPESRGLRR